MNEHRQVAPYALGLLDAREMSRFEEHLVDCDECATQLEWMLPVADRLADVEPGDLFGVDGLSAFSAPVTAEPRTGEIPARRPRTNRPRTGEIPVIVAATGETPSRRPRTGEIPVIVPADAEPRRIVPLVRGGESRRREPARPQRPRGRRRSLLVAAAAAVLGAVVGGGVVGMHPWSTGTPTDVEVASADGERFTATDTRTGVKADVVLEPKAWGTLVSFAVADIDGPRTCRLVAVRRDGRSEVLSSWAVPGQGYGKDTEPPRLELEASTALPRNEIAALVVQDLGAQGGTTNLVTVNS